MQQKPIATLVEKIAKECEDANADKWTITKIVKELNTEETRDMQALRRRALQLLQQLDPKAAAIYDSFRRMQVRTSGERIEPFDRGNIIKSLLRETDVTRGVAEKIGREVEDKIKDLEIANINTALIREIVNVKLLEYGHESVRNQYTRLGLPVADVRKKIEKAPCQNREIMAEYNLLCIIPPELARMHLSGEIFIGSIQDFSTKPIALSILPSPKESPLETACAALGGANRLGEFCSWQPNIHALNAGLACSAKKSAVKEAAARFGKIAENVFCRKKAALGFVSLHLFEPGAMDGMNVDKDAMVAAANGILKACCETASLPFGIAIAIDTKYKLHLLKEKNAQGAVFLNCKSREYSMLNGIAVPGNGICSFIGVNLTGIALECKGNESAFTQALQRKTDAMAKLDALKRKQMQERGYLRKNGIHAGEFPSVIALDSLMGAGKIAIGEGSAKEALGFAEKTVAGLKETLPENTVLAELQNRKALSLFSEANEKRFGVSAQIAPEGKELRKSAALQRNFSFTATAENKRQLSELLDSHVRTVVFRRKPQPA